MQSTIALFRKMYESLPPFFPADVRKKMHHALGHLESDNTISSSEVEDTMIIFGYQSWPWQRAYREFFDLAEHRVGEHFLLPKLTPITRERYEYFKHYGGTLRDLHTGRHTSFFSEAEHHNLREALVEIGPELRDYTNRIIIGVEKDKYFSKVEEFRKVLDSIRTILGQLQNLADEEQDHPSLASEIRERVRAFEHGLCLLGPEPSLEEALRLPEHFAGRRHELNQLRGINLPGEFRLDD